VAIPLGVFEYLVQLLCISSLDVVRNVILSCVVDQGDDVACIGEAEAVKLDGNRQFLRRDPDIDGFR
jgi:hypothetical protein